MIQCPHCCSYAEEYPDFGLSFEVQTEMWTIPAPDHTIKVQRYECQAPDCQKAFYVEKEATE